MNFAVVNLIRIVYQNKKMFRVYSKYPLELKHSLHVLSCCSCLLILNYHRQKLHHNFILKE